VARKDKKSKSFVMGKSSSAYLHTPFANKGAALSPMAKNLEEPQYFTPATKAYANKKANSQL